MHLHLCLRGIYILQPLAVLHKAEMPDSYVRSVQFWISHFLRSFQFMLISTDRLLDLIYALGAKQNSPFVHY